MVPFRMVSWIQRSLGLRPRFRRLRRRKIAGLNHGAMSARVAPLEVRILPSAVTSVSDLNGDTDFQNDSSHPREFTTIGNLTFFTYNSQVSNKPLLAFTDSTTGITTILPDQTNFRFSPNTQISELTVFQGKLYFVASDGNPSMALGKELWSLDPASINAATGFATFTCITDFDGVHGTTVDINGTIKNAINGRQTLTDGTTTGGSKNEGSDPAQLTVSGGKLYFTATDDLSGQGGNRELYFFDGTKVQLVKDINTNPIFLSASSTPLQLTDAGGLLYFTAVDTVNNGRELWRTDGTAAGTFMLANIKPNGDGDVSEITPANGTSVFFSANNGAVGNELWFSDGTSAGTRLVKDIQGPISGVNQGSNPTSMLWVNGTLYFAADDGIVGKELWKSDGTDAGTVLVRDIAQTGPNGTFDVKQNSTPHNLTLVNGLIYFSANDGREGFELWRTDGSAAGTQIVSLASDPSPVPGHPFAGINRGLTSSGDSTGGSYPGSLLNVNGTLYFIATNVYDQNGQTNFELWRVNSATGLIEKAGAEINQLSNVWQSQFDIPDQQQDFTYAKSMADAFHPTVAIPDASPTGFRKGASNNQLFLGPAGLIYFAADNAANGTKVNALGEYLPNFEPWRFNTATQTASLVKDMTVQSLLSMNPFGFTTTTVIVPSPATGGQVVRTRTFFFFTDTRLSSKTIGMGYFDGETGQVVDSGLRFDSIGTNQRPDPQVFGNFILFTANGREVWRTNGTLTGTDVVATADVSIDLLTVSGTRYFYYGVNVTYSGNTPSFNGEIWSGTGNVPATLVQEIAPTVNANNRSTNTLFITPAGGNSVWFNADDSGATNNGSRNVLWISNGLTTGTPVGTRIVVSAAAAGATNPTGPQGPRNPYAAASTPNVVYFAAGITLYRSSIGADQAGTDLNTFAITPALGTISNITVVTNGVFFVVNGNSLYFSDGINPANTVFVGNFAASDFRAIGNRLYFVDGGSELYSVDVTPPVPPVPGPAAPATPGPVTLVNQLTALTNINSLILTGTRLYFSAQSAAGGQELWTSLAGAEPTQVTDIQAGPADSLNVPGSPHSRIGIGNGRVFFGANELSVGEVLNSVPIGGNTLDPTLRDVIRPTTADSNARDFIVLDVDTFGSGFQPAVFFFSDVGPMRSVLSRIATDPSSPSGLVNLTNIAAFKDWNRSFYDDYTAANSQIDVPSPYLPGSEYLPSNNGNGIFKAGGTATANFGGYLGTQFLFFGAQTSLRTTGDPSFYYSSELYVLDSRTNLNPVRIGDIRVAAPGVQGNAKPGYLTSIGNNADGNSTFVLFAASSGATNGALWRVTTTNAQPGTWTPTQISDAQNPRFLQSLGGGQTTGGRIYFTAGPENARTAWVTDGTTTTQLSTAIVDESAGDGNIFGFSNGMVYFSAREPGNNTNFELYQTVHATGATALLKDINVGIGGSRPGNFTDVNGVMYFAANDGVHGFELWKTDGTAAGTVMVQDIEPGAAGSNPGVVISTRTATDLAGNTTVTPVYTYQGFVVANTRPDEFGVTNAGFNPANPQNPSKPNSGDDNGTPTLLFAATTTQYGRELWQVASNTFSIIINGVTYSGTKDVPQIVKDLAPGSRSSNPNNLTAIDGTVYFSADDGLSGDTLWQSIGVDQLTGNTLTRKMLDDADILSGNSALVNGIRNPDNFILLTTNNKTINRLIFTAANDLGKTELYQLNINHTPTALNLSTNAVPENQPQGTVVGTLVTTDPDFGDSFQYQFVTGSGDTDNGMFQIVGTSLQIKQPLDFEDKNSYTVRIRTTDQRGQFYERAFTINVSDVNEAPTDLKFVDPITGLDLADDTARIDEVPSLAPADPPPTTQDILLADLAPVGDDAITANNVFSIVPGQLDADAFAVDKRNGLNYQIFLKAGAVLNFEVKGEYKVNVQILDPTVAGMTPVVRTFTLILNDLNESPIGPLSDSDPTANVNIDGVDYNGAVNENSPAGTSVGITALAIDPDTQLNPVSYTLLNNAGGRFQINPTTGVVSVLNGLLLDYESATEHTIIVRADSTDGTFSTATFIIRVNDVNEFATTPIIDTNPAANSVLENAPNGTVVGLTAFAVDLDGSNNAITYSLISDAGGRFAIDPVTGVVTVANGALIDREQTHAWSIDIRATSQDGSFSRRPFTIFIEDVNEFAVGPINDIDPAENTVLENSPNGTPVGITARAVDADATNNVVTYSLTSNAGGRFAINPTTGVIFVANGALLDREQAAAWSVNVLATSQDGSTSQRAFTIFIGDVNEFAVGPVTDVNTALNAVNENAPNGTLVGITARAIDGDATAVVTYALLNNAGGRFAINPTTGVVTVANGSLLDREAAASHSIVVQATSNDGSTSQQTFTIAVNDVNEFAVGPITNVFSPANASSVTIAEHSPIGFQVGITANAVDLDATNNRITYSLPNSAGGRFAINPLTGVVTVANSALIDREATEAFMITVQAQSQDGSISTRNFTIFLTDINDNPVSQIVDTNPAVNQVPEMSPTGTLVGITAFATDPDVSNIGLPMIYTLQDTSGGRYKIDPITGVVMVDDGTLIDYEKGTTNTIIVRATAPDGSFNTQTFTINVLDVYEAPVLTISNNTVAENMPVGTAVGIFGVENATPTSPVYRLVSGAGSTNNSSFQIVNNQLRTRSSFNFEAKSSYSVRVQVTSANGVTATQVFTINVTNVNEAPTNVTLSKSSVSRSAPIGTVVGLLSGVDPDAGSTFNYSLVPGSGSTGNSRFTIVGNELRVNGPLTGSSTKIRVRVTDQGGLSYEKTLTIKFTA